MSVVRSPRSAVLLSSLLFALSAGNCLAAGERQVGVSAAVNPDVTSMPPGGAKKTLVLGQNVVFNERIQTAAAGQTQLLFLDQSAMTVGPNSDLTIDKFVYNPDSGTGNMTVSAAKGVLRFVGGKLSKQDNGVEVKTPQATIAVRGGAFLLQLTPGGRADIFFIYGRAVTVTGTNGVTQTVSRPGFAITVAGPGASPSPPAPAPPGAIDTVLVQIDGRSGGSGGAAQVPTEVIIANSGISNTISGDINASVQSAVQNLPTNSTIAVLNGSQGNTLSNPTATPVTPPIVPVDCAVTNCGTISPQTFFTQTPITPITPIAPPPGPSNTVIQFAGNFRSTNGQGTARGFADPNAKASYAGGTLTFPPGSPQQGIFTATLQTSQGPITVQFPLVPGNSTINPSQTQSPLGPVGGTTFLAADNSYFFANLQPINFPTEKAFAFGGNAVSPAIVPNQVTAYAVQRDAALQSAIPFLRNNTGGALPNASVSPLYMVSPGSTTLGAAAGNGTARTLQTSVAINGNGANQQSAIAVNLGTLQNSGAPAVNGVVRGSSQLSTSGTPTAIRGAANSVIDGNGNSIYGPAGGNSVTGFTLDQGQALASEVALSGATTTYGFAQPVIATAVPSGVGTNRTTQTQTGWFGGTINSNATTRPYAVAGTVSLNTNAATNGVAATFAGAPVTPTAAAGVTGITMQYGGPGGQQAFVDDKTFAAAESVASSQQLTVNGASVAPNGQLYMASSGAAPAPQSLLPPGGTYCDCQYLQWGAWGGDLTTPNGTANPRVDRGHINYWVAGQPTSPADIASLQNASLGNAQASYAGHAIGSVANNGLQYVAAGNFNGSYNFASQQMSLAVTNFDGHNFSGVTALGGKTPVTVSGGSNSYALPVNNTAGFGGTFNGSFYGPQAANTAGNFSAQSTAGPSYIASGIYAGKR